MKSPVKPSVSSVIAQDSSARALLVPDRDHPSADAPRQLDRGDRRGRNRVPFGLHRVPLDFRRAHGRKSSGSDMQGEKRRTDTGRRQLFEQLRR